MAIVKQFSPSILLPLIKINLKKKESHLDSYGMMMYLGEGKVRLDVYTSIERNQDFRKELPRQIMDLKNLLLVTSNVELVAPKPLLLTDDTKLQVVSETSAKTELNFSYQKLRFTVARDVWTGCVMAMCYLQLLSDYSTVSPAEEANNLILDETEDFRYD